MMSMNLLACLLVVTLVPQETKAPPAAAPKAQTPAPATPAQPAGRSDNYVIGPQDQLSITVFEEPSLTGKYRVENDGFFNFPFLERVRAAGRTLSGLQAEMTKLLADGFIRNPQVRVEIDQYKSQTIFVTGEVRSPNDTR